MTVNIKYSVINIR